VVERGKGLRSVNSNFQDIDGGASFRPTELEAEVNVLWLVIVSHMVIATQASGDAKIKP
jgi:hypothetical protein